MTPANPLGRLRGAWLRLAPLRQRACLALLALLLVQVQGLGLWHRVAHGGPAVASAGAAWAVQAQPGARAEAYDHAHHGQAAYPGAHGLFGHDAGDESGCRLFDQLAAADALLAASALLADERPATVAAAPVSSQGAGRTLRPYQARAPPLA